MTKQHFSYNLIEGDPTVEEIRYKERFFEFDETKPLEYDTSYVELYNALVGDKDLRKNSKLPIYRIDKNRVINSIKIWENLGIKLHDIELLDKSYKIKNGYFVVDKKFQESLNLAQPKKIPVVFSNNQVLEGKCNYFTLESSENKDKKSVIFRDIIVPILNNNLSICAYGHEISHTQLTSVWEGTNNLLNIETIPIFIEQLFAYITDPTTNTLLKYRCFRLYDLVEKLYIIDQHKNLAYISKITYDTFIQSTLQAIKLFNTYAFGNANIQDEFIKYINKIFAGDILIEEMLNHFEANLDQVEKDSSILKKVKPI